MALIDRVKERFSNDLLVKLTNIDDAPQTTTNDTFLQRVCDDVQAEFVAWMNEDYDESIRVLIVAACALVKRKCFEYGGAPALASDAENERLEKFVTRLREVRARDRVRPESSSNLTVRTPGEDGQEVNPNFDDKYFTDMTPESTGVDDPNVLD